MKSPTIISTLARAFGRPVPPVGTTPSDVIWKENKWSLLRYRPRPEGVQHATPIVLVPSLINRHYVLDLLPGKSFAEYLVRRGHDVYCIDWGTPEAEDRYTTFDDICDRAIGRAIRQSARFAGAEKAHVLGYCLGGTLTAIHAAVRPERIASLSLVAAPVRFDDDGLLARWTQTKTFDLDALVDAYGNVPWQVMQGAFHLLRPTLNLAKAVGFIDRASDDKFLDGFFALETWGNDNVSFPGEAYRTYIDALYRKNKLVRGELILSGERADLANITCPVQAVTFEHDNIVPKESAIDVLDRVKSATKDHVHVPGGHVGAMVSGSAAKHVWPKIEAFFLAAGAASAPVREGGGETSRGTKTTVSARGPKTSASASAVHAATTEVAASAPVAEEVEVPVKRGAKTSKVADAAFARERRPSARRVPKKHGAS